MSETRTVRTLGVAAPNEPRFFSYEEEPPGEGQFRVDTLYTGLSAGTELTFVKGTNPYLHSSWDAERGVFCEGEPSQTYPVRVMGYMEVARVVETRTPAVANGDVVALNYGHRTGHVVDSERSVITVLPDSLDPVLGVYVAQMGPICANGLLHAAAEAVGVAPDGDRNPSLGDGVRDRRVLVTGAGVVGLLTGLFAHAEGAAEVAVADPDRRRLEVAEALGLKPVVAEDSDTTWRWCASRWRNGPADNGADLVFQCRGRTTALVTALRSLRPQGTVIDLAFYQGGAPELRLGEEFHHNGLAIRCAQIGRVPRGLAGTWDRRRLCRKTLELLQSHGDLVRQHLVTDLVPLDEAPALMRDLADRRRSTVQAVFAVAP